MRGPNAKFPTPYCRLLPDRVGSGALGDFSFPPRKKNQKSELICLEIDIQMNMCAYVYIYTCMWCTLERLKEGKSSEADVREFSTSPELRTKSQQDAPTQFVLGLFRDHLSLADRQNCGSGAFKPAKGFGIKAVPCSVLWYFWESWLGSKERYVH